MPRLEAVIRGYAHQADATLSQANPVSGTKYEVLATTKNVRIITMSANIPWAVTQPTPLEVHVTIDGQIITFSKTNPVSAINYSAKIREDRAEGSQELDTLSAYGPFRAFLLEGRSVKVESEITWSVTQPTPLVCRVKYAKIP